MSVDPTVAQHLRAAGRGAYQHLQTGIGHANTALHSEGVWGAARKAGATAWSKSPVGALVAGALGVGLVSHFAFNAFQGAHQRNLMQQRGMDSQGFSR